MMAQSDVCALEPVKQCSAALQTSGRTPPLHPVTHPTGGPRLLHHFRGKPSEVRRLGVGSA